MPKFLLLKHYRGGPEPYKPYPPMDRWAPEDVEAHIAFQRHVRDLLEERGVGTAVADPGALGREGLGADELAALLEQVADVALEGDVRLDVLGRPPVHRRVRLVGLGAAAVVLEQQELGHRGPRGCRGRAARGRSPGERSRPDVLDSVS